ncbi:MAG: hypothetical protein M3530_06965 [Thermoproteota archaeon]|nr:hypothetical protein [Thermoproteota archaeon]
MTIAGHQSGTGLQWLRRHRNNKGQDENTFDKIKAVPRLLVRKFPTLKEIWVKYEKGLRKE